MADQFVEYSSQGYFSRIGDSIKGVLFGLLLFGVSIVLLFLNERHAVHRERALHEGSKAVVSVGSDAIDASKEGKLIHFTGSASGGPLYDPTFGVAQDAIHLKRGVEMYQWKEEEHTEEHNNAVGGGSTRTRTFDYSKVWSDKLIDSSRFEHRTDHENPATMRVQADHWAADPVKVGAFTLPRGLVDDIDNFTPIPVTEAVRSELTSDLKDDSTVADQALYISGNRGSWPDAKSPRVGDVRVTFKAAAPGPVTVMARQSGRTLAPFDTSNGPLFILHTGTETAAQLIHAEQEKNTIITWILRAVGFILMWLGLALIAGPIQAMSNLIGFLGDIAGVGIVVVSLLVAVALSTFTIAIAWLVFRPLIGVALLAVAAAAIFLIGRLRGQVAARRLAVRTAALRI